MARQLPTAVDAKDRGKQSTSPPRASSSRLVWFGSRLFVVAVLLVLVVFFAPPLIGNTGIWKSLLHVAAPEIAGQIDASSLQLAWLSPIEIRGLVVRDQTGQPLAELPVIRSHKTLLAIALDSHDVGVFDVDQPRLKIALRADSSNAEDLLARLPKSKSQGKSASVGFGLALTKGVVELDDQVAGRRWQLENLNVDLNWPAAAEQPKSGKLAAVIQPVGSEAPAAQIGAEFSWQAGTQAKSPLGAGQAQVTLQGFPTEILQGALRRFAGEIRPRGPLTLQAAGAWKDSGAIQLLVNQLTTPGLSVAAPKWLGADQPTVAVTSGQAALQLGDGRLDVRNLQLLTNLFTISGKGSAGSGGASGDVELTGQLNLAELTRQLPNTLHLKPATQVTSGVAEVSLMSRTAADARRWQGSLKTSNLRGVAAGRAIEFDQPLEIDFDVRQTAAGPVIDRLIGQASFLRLEGRGALADGSIAASADLDRLVAELDRLVDLGDTRLAGTLAADVRWKHEQATGWTANADAVVQNFEAAAPRLAPWKEPNLRMAANVQGDLAGASLQQINVARFTVEAGSDRLEAELTQPVKQPSAASVWPARFTLRGDLATWTPRLQPFVPLGGWRVAGAIECGGNLRFSPQETELSQTTVQMSQLAVDGSGVSIREPIVKIETAGAWSQAKSTLTLASTTLASSALALRADGVRVAAGKEPSLVGLIDFRGDLAKLSGWLASGQQPRTSQVAGALTGRVEIGYRGQALAATWTADAENVAYLVAPPPIVGRRMLASESASPGWQAMWQEPRINFAGQGTFDPATGALKVVRTSLAASSGSLAAVGAVSKLTTAPEVDLSGEVTYDLALVTQQIQSHARRADTASPRGQAALPYGLDTLQLTGKQKRPFTLKGPLFAATGALTPSRAPSDGAATKAGGFGVSEALTGEASLGWQGAQYVGLVAGPADFRAKLSGGLVQIGPLDIPLSEGRLTTAPRILLNNHIPSAVFDRGPLLQNVRISPEMCSLWLKYVAPLVAEATRAEGKFSLSLQGADLPLSAPLASDAAGTMQIHSAQIGPGPLAQQYVALARQIRALFDGPTAAAATDNQHGGWLVLPQQDVLFEVRDGAVRNRGLTMSVGDVVITTEGTVEIETQKINLIASIPLNESWFKKQDGMFASLKGKTVQIPIDGTLTQPRLDTKVLQSLGKQLAGSAVQGVIGKQLERGQGLLNKELQRGEGLLPGDLGQGINRLFGPRQPATPPQQPPPSPAPR